MVYVSPGSKADSKHVRLDSTALANDGKGGVT